MGIYDPFVCSTNQLTRHAQAWVGGSWVVARTRHSTVCSEQPEGVGIEGERCRGTVRVVHLFRLSPMCMMHEPNTALPPSSRHPRRLRETRVEKE